MINSAKHHFVLCVYYTYTGTWICAALFKAIAISSLWAILREQHIFTVSKRLTLEIVLERINNFEPLNFRMIELRTFQTYGNILRPNFEPPNRDVPKHIGPKTYWRIILPYET